MTQRRDPDPHPLRATGTDAVRGLVEFYDEAIIDANRVATEWQFRALRAESDRNTFANQLHDLMRLLPLDKKPDETVAAAVLRYVGQLSEAVSFEAFKGANSILAARDAFRQLCEKHNITEPCVAFVLAGAQIGKDAAMAVCETCGHPNVVHAAAAPAATEAAS